MQRKQSGLSMVGFVLVAGLVAIVVILGMKSVPAVIEYYTILKNVKAIVKSGEVKGGTVADYRNAYAKRAIMDEMSSVTPADLDIVKDTQGVEISFAYQRKVPLFGPVSLLFDFEGSASGSN
ncbi:MAG: DUF4845 domain-containing protein [Methyloversatilis discipulorum]|jgi:hypothetical protein|uniref:DUF4845 domain-containing protein n=1 Tax=Methyloversatilis discipulorum TaxID=1119528 RepID=UPI0026E921ED|nr:DUF4845 domain-containing protein [Methyloversatilis discipulorum]MBV5284661.1 DUF4845 domain-containing protein [Methyloversatilis discipulorum]